MAILDFPSSPAPVVGNTYSIGLRAWQWNGIGWARIEQQNLLGGGYRIFYPTTVTVVANDFYYMDYV